MTAPKTGPPITVELECRHQIPVTPTTANNLTPGDGFKCPHCRLPMIVAAICRPDPS